MLAEPLSPAERDVRRADGRAVEWAVSRGYTPYEAAVAAMEARVAAIAAGEAAELVWLLEHPPLYTAGVSARDGDLLDAARFPVHRTGRGGQFTYHGPGQRVAYVMLDLTQRGRDVRGLVRGLERWLIGALGEFGVEAGVREGRVGVWVERPAWKAGAAGGLREDKIAVNALWPVTLIESQATMNFGIGDAKTWRKAEIVADAALELVTTPPAELTGQALLDEDFLKMRGWTDFTQYRCDPEHEPPRLTAAEVPKVGLVPRP